MRRAWQGQRRNKVLSLAIPIILANISVPLVGMVDTAVMGRMADPVYMGAVALGATIFSSIFWLFGFLRMGTGDADASSGIVDSPDSESWQVELTLYRALITGAVLGILLVLLQYPIAQFAAAAFSAGAELESLMHDYFYIRIYAAPATLITYSVIGALIGLQKMRAIQYHIDRLIFCGLRCRCQRCCPGHSYCRIPEPCLWIDGCHETCPFDTATRIVRATFLWSIAIY